MRGKTVIVRTAIWGDSYEEVIGLAVLRAHGCWVGLDRWERRMVIRFPEGTTREWELRTGRTEIFELRLPSGLKLREVFCTTAGESGVGVLGSTWELEITKLKDVSTSQVDEGESG